MNTDKDIKEINQKVEEINEREAEKKLFWDSMGYGLALMFLGCWFFGMDEFFDSWLLMILFLSPVIIGSAIAQVSRKDKKENKQPKENKKEVEKPSFEKQIEHLEHLISQEQLQSNTYSFSSARCFILLLISGKLVKVPPTQRPET